MLSTMHNVAMTHDDEEHKSDIQLFYNSTKSGVDVCDKMAKEYMYTVRVSCKRWPIVHFHNQLNVSGINAFTIFNFHHPEWSSKPTLKRRREFLLKLATELAMEFTIFCASTIQSGCRHILFPPWNDSLFRGGPRISNHEMIAEESANAALILESY